MGYLLHLLLAMAALVAADEGLVLRSTWGGFLALPLALLPLGLGALIQRWLVRGRFRAALRAERVLVHGPVLLHAAAVLALDWLGFLARWVGLEVSLAGWPGFELVAGLAPFLVYELVTIAVRARLGDSRPDEVRRARGFQVRLFLSTLLPVLLFLGVSSCIRASERARAWLEEVALLDAGLSVALLVAFVLAMPVLLRHTWDTAPVERGPLRSTLEELARAAGFRCRELLVWRTANQMANAAIVGFTPRSRIVLFSDALLAQLRPSEVAAVFAHEVGHARRHHAAYFAAFAILAFLAIDLFLGWIELDGDAQALGLLALGIAVWYVAFGWLSRRFELEADLESLELLGHPRPLIDALHAVVGAHAHERTSWRHFSAARRVRFLQEVAADAGVGERLRRVLGRWKAVLAVLFVAAVGLELLTLASSWSEDSALAHLRLGEFAAAAASLERAPHPPPELVLLVERAQELSPEEGTPGALAERARRALARGELELAALDLHLALLRGADPRLGSVLAALAEERATRARLRALQGELDPPWAEALERFLGRAPEGSQ